MMPVAKERRNLELQQCLAGMECMNHHLWPPLTLVTLVAQPWNGNRPMGQKSGEGQQNTRLGVVVNLGIMEFAGMAGYNDAKAHEFTEIAGGGTGIRTQEALPPSDFQAHLAPSNRVRGCSWI